MSNTAIWTDRERKALRVFLVFIAIFAAGYLWAWDHLRLKSKWEEAVAEAKLYRDARDQQLNTATRLYEQALQANLESQVRMYHLELRERILNRPLVIKGITLDDESLDWSTLEDHVVLIDLWGRGARDKLTWDRLKEVHARYHEQGLRIVGCTDLLGRDREDIRRRVAENQIPWPNLTGVAGSPPEFNEVAMRQWYPTFILLDRRGVVVACQGDFDPQLSKQIRECLDQSAVPPVNVQGSNRL